MSLKLVWNKQMMAEYPQEEIGYDGIRCDGIQDTSDRVFPLLEYQKRAPLDVLSGGNNLYY